MARIRTYSYLRASIGLSCEAFLAGQIPNTIPTAIENIVARAIAEKETFVVQPAANESAAAIPMPIAIPITPPLTDITIASMMN